MTPQRTGKTAFYTILIVTVLILLSFGVYHFGFRDTKEVNIAPNLPTANIPQNAEVPRIRFVDVTTEAGIRFTHVNGMTPNKLMPETMSGGVATFDYNNDGFPDILFVNSCYWPGHQAQGQPEPTLKLYKNLGGWKFEDVTESVGLNVSLYGMGVAIGDYDNDGHDDIFVSCIGQHRLFRNVDGMSFQDVTTTAKVGGPGTLPNVSAEEFMRWDQPIPFGSSATFVDYDGDAFLDLFVCHYLTWSPKVDQSIGSTLSGSERTFGQPREFDGTHCSLFRNVDGKTFVDVSEAAGVRVYKSQGTDMNAKKFPLGKSLGVVVCDPDQDGWPDLVVANDTVQNFYFQNQSNTQGQRVFEEIGYIAGVAYADEGKPRGGMGIDWTEYAPGRCAISIANFSNEPVTFLDQFAPKKAQFSDAAVNVGLSGPSRSALKFGLFFFDYDNDTRPDLFFANGHIEPDIQKIQQSQEYAQPAQLFWNAGGDPPRYEAVSAEAAGDDLFQPLVGRGCAYADLDLDGDLDIVMVGNGGPGRVFRNDANAVSVPNNWIRLVLHGDGKTVSRSAIGAVVRIRCGDTTIERCVAGAKGYLSQSEFPLTVGLGSTKVVDELTVRWPGKDIKVQTWKNLQSGQTHQLVKLSTR